MIHPLCAIINDFPDLSAQEMQPKSFRPRHCHHIDIWEIQGAIEQKVVQLKSGCPDSVEITDDELQVLATQIAEVTNKVTLSDPLSEYCRLQRTLAAYQIAYTQVIDEGVSTRLESIVQKLVRLVDLTFPLLEPTLKGNILTYLERKSGNKELPWVGYRAEATRSLSLEEKRELLRLVNAKKVPIDEVFEYWEGQDTVALLKDCGDELTYLQTNQPLIYGTNERLAQILACTPNLKEFVVASSNDVFSFGSVWLRDSFLCTLARLCPKLEAITLVGHSLGQKALHALAQCKELRSVIFKRCVIDDASLALFLPSISSLKTVCITEAPGITSQTVRLLVDTNKELEIVELNETAIDDSGVRDLVTNLPSLKHLYLTGCEKVTDTWVDMLSAQLPITELALTSTRMTESGVMRAVKLCPQLEELMIRELPVTDALVQELIASCPALRDFSIHATNITDAGLVQLITHYHEILTEIHLATHRVTEAGLKVLSLKQMPPRLKKISFNEAFKNSGGARQLIESWKDVEIEWRELK